MSDIDDYHESGITPNSDSDDSDSDGYDINDPRTREHAAYKISQDNAGRARRRYKYGDDIDAKGLDDSTSGEDSDDLVNNDPMELRLQNAREARGWALDEANRRYEWNARWAGGDHPGVEEEADKRMADVEGWNHEIDNLERQINHARDARAHNPDSGSEPSSDEEDSAEDCNEDYEKQVLDAREARERRHDFNDGEEKLEEDSSDDDFDDEEEEELDSDY